MAEAFLEKGHKVWILDNLSSGQEKNIPSEASFIQADIRDAEQLESLFQQIKFDLIFHAAAQINLRESLKNPKLDLEINLIGTLNLLEQGRKTGIRRFVFTSTGGAIYGDATEVPHK